MERSAERPIWAKVIDQTRCIGCHACTTACKSENEVPLTVTRTYVKYVDVGAFPQSRRAFQVTRCNQCEDAPCVVICPTAAMFRRPDGIVDFDKRVCIGCKACIAACPYDAIFMNPDDHSAEKCNLCAHRVDQGLEPACVVVCPTEAILVGDLRDPNSEVARVVHREPVTVRRPEKGTRPKLFYVGAHQATLDPLAARRPRGGGFMWSEERRSRDAVSSGHPGAPNSAAAAVLAYDIEHRAPWDWRVSLYTWTKSIAAGAYLVTAVLLLLGLLDANSVIWRWVAPLLSGGFLGATAALLISDLEHPWRFYLLLTRPQGRSWLVRGAIVLVTFGALLVLHLVSELSGRPIPPAWLIAAGVPLALLAAAYTGSLFAQAKARDLWQNPLLPPHLVVQAGLAGSAALLVLAPQLEPAASPVLSWTVGATSLVHLLLVAGELTLTHTSEHARLAVTGLIRGRFRVTFWLSTALIAIGLAAPWWSLAAAAGALVGLALYEHAYVQAGQSVPLA